MAVRRNGLGRGLDALIRDISSEEPVKEEVKKVSKPEKAEKESKSTKKTSKSDTVVPKAPSKTTDKTDKVDKAEKAEKAEKTDKADKADKAKAATKKADKAKSAEKVVKAEKTDKAVKAPDKPVKAVKPAPTVEVEEKPIEAAAAVVEEKAPTLPVEKGEQIVRISLVEPNRSQPRKTFSDASISELADSIRQHGVIQPLLVQAKEDHYEIIAGERRWRASKEAGLKEIPVIVRDYSTQEAVEVSLIENIQREDLNPIEEAKAYRNLMTDFALKQEDVAQKVSKSRAAIANAMRLLKLDVRVQDMVIEGLLTEGHARALLVIEDGDVQLSLAEQIVKEHMSVRQVETMIRQLSKPEKKAKEKDPQREAVMMSLSEKLKSALGTKVTINQKTKHKGVIEIEYYSDDDLERVYELLVNAKTE